MNTDRHSAEAGMALGRGFSVHVAMVECAGRLALLAVDLTPAGLSRQLGEYVREHASVQLWAAEHELVQRLLADGRDAEAVEEYFARVGERWDNERLVVRRFDIGENSADPGAGVETS